MSQETPDQAKTEALVNGRRMRLLYSLNDLQQAMSASTFLHECDETQKYSRADLRRFRCYETALVAAYMRPFSQARGAAAPLTMDMIGLELSPSRAALHEQLRQMRNTMIAHSDTAMMRMTTQSFDIEMGDGEPPMYFVEAVFDEGVTLVGNMLFDTNELVNEVYHAVFKTLHADQQSNPKLYEMRIDSDQARSIRNVKPQSPE
jgi:hypothetical protein